MSLREIRIPPFKRPDQSIQAARVSALLVDSSGEALLGQISPGGDPVSGSADELIGAAPVSIFLTPQTEIAPASRYLFRVRVGGIGETFSASIPAGAAPLTWADLRTMGAPLSPAELSALALHLAAATLHLANDERAALDAALNTPSAGNPIATIADVIGGGLPSAEADEAIAAGQPIRLAATGHAAPADATIPGRAEVAGVAVAAAGVGFAATYSRSRVTLADWTAVTGGASLTPGAIYYLDPAAPGTLTTTAPEAPGTYSTRVGRAAAADTFQIEIEPPIRL